MVMIHQLKSERGISARQTGAKAKDATQEVGKILRTKARRYESTDGREPDVWNKNGIRADTRD
jgi:hypothetical protein